MRLDYKELVDRIRACTLCPLHQTRRNPVPGEGPLDARLMLVGEAPGRREDEQGRPFVGMAGRLLNTLLAGVGLGREQVYITNVVKCRPPGNRDPRPEEIRACLPYLQAQIRIVRPQVLVTLGRISGETLFRAAGLGWRGISRERGRPRKATLYGVPLTLLATYHPAAALYNPRIRPLLEEDFSLIPGLLGEKAPGRGRSLEDFF